MEDILYLTFEDKYDCGLPVAIIEGGEFADEIIYCIDKDREKEMKNKSVHNKEEEKKTNITRLDKLDDICRSYYIDKIKEEEFTPMDELLKFAKGIILNSTPIIKSKINVDSKTISVTKNKEFKKNEPIRPKGRGKSQGVCKELSLLYGGDSMIYHIPNILTRSVGLIAGQSGSGKSTYARQYAIMYHKLYPNNAIWLYSKINEDPAFDDLAYIIRVKIDENIVVIDVENMPNCLCIFDDIDTFPNLKIRSILNKQVVDLLQCGRKYNIDVLRIQHQICNYRETREILNECTFLTVFPKCSSTQPIKQVLKNYIGLDNSQIDKIINLPSRWVTIFKNHPSIVLYQYGCYILN